jgi:uncharacterized metal-binding protein
MKNDPANCARCSFKVSDRLCRTEQGKSPDFCPTANLEELARQSLETYKNDAELYEFARQASIQEGTGYADKERGYEHVRPAKTRIEEIIDFAGRMNYRRIGMAFCIGLRNEAKAVEKLISARDFEVVSAVCKVGRNPKQVIGVEFGEQIDPSTEESMCNPVLQAMILNHERTDFNILLGLCVGHDSMFFKYSEAPCTVLAVKDRVLGHNPLAAIYNVDSYYRSLK